MTSFEQLRAQFKILTELSKKRIAVGWIDGNGTARKAYDNLQAKKETGENQPSIKEQPSNALIARTLNFGREEGTTAEGRHYGKIPARPFMKYATENFNKLLPKIQAHYFPLIMKGQYTIEQFQKLVGKLYADEVTKAIRDSSKYQPISAKTLARRRHHGSTSAVPLIDTHQMVDSVSFEVR